jgi:hypothetical protein
VVEQNCQFIYTGLPFTHRETRNCELFQGIPSLG